MFEGYVMETKQLAHMYRRGRRRGLSSLGDGWVVLLVVDSDSEQPCEGGGKVKDCFSNVGDGRGANWGIRKSFPFLMTR